MEFWGFEKRDELPGEGFGLFLATVIYRTADGKLVSKEDLAGITADGDEAVTEDDAVEKKGHDTLDSKDPVKGKDLIAEWYEKSEGGSDVDEATLGIDVDGDGNKTGKFKAKKFTKQFHIKSDKEKGDEVEKAGDEKKAKAIKDEKKAWDDGKAREDLPGRIDRAQAALDDWGQSLGHKISKIANTLPDVGDAEYKPEDLEGLIGKASGDDKKALEALRGEVAKYTRAQKAIGEATSNKDSDVEKSTRYIERAESELNLPKESSGSGSGGGGGRTASTGDAPAPGLVQVGTTSDGRPMFVMAGTNSVGGGFVGAMNGMTAGMHAINEFGSAVGVGTQIGRGIYNSVTGNGASGFNYSFPGGAGSGLSGPGGAFASTNSWGGGGGMGGLGGGGWGGGGIYGDFTGTGFMISQQCWENKANARRMRGMIEWLIAQLCSGDLEALPMAVQLQSAVSKTTMISASILAIRAKQFKDAKVEEMTNQYEAMVGSPEFQADPQRFGGAQQLFGVKINQLSLLNQPIDGILKQAMDEVQAETEFANGIQRKFGQIREAEGRLA